MKYILNLMLMILVSQSASAQDILGTWVSIDDKSGEAKSHVELYKGADGMIQGKIVKLLANDDEVVCQKCPTADARYMKPVLGMNIINDMQLADDWYENGFVLDPNSGRIYDCKFKIDENDPDRLIFRGYLGWLYRTQYWQRL